MQPPATALLIYPVTLVVGSLFSVLSPTAQGSRDHALYGTAGGPLTPATPVNYFARKDNVFNLYFVKVGWLWTTLAFAVVLLSLDAYRTPSSQRLRRMGQATARYALATLVWYLTTQWCFGPAIIDRSFVVTGGRCEHMVPSVGGSGSNHDDDDPFGFHSLFTAAACKSAGGAWRGGHDVSGHVFMLVLTTSMLGFETVGALGAGDEESGRRKCSMGS
ncbi:hypothetical protein EYZ11_003500 [Aspergillus tanneri]|uniref:Uncharacterized protein n=1 Tax=Aspergillus tanneri TaxID=1220188 RepID=A0A4S3JN04_9EURO|nr:hypothetical protein EYZ11_003500 [Aspergillus tanneri]